MFSYFIILFYILCIFTLAIIFRKFAPHQKELLRKIIHIGIGPLIPIVQYLKISQITALVITGFMSFLILLNYKYKIFPIIEDVNRKSYGTFFYCFSLFILILFFWNKDPLSLTTGFLIMTFGDGLAGLIGKNFPSKTWSFFKQKKSLLGTITMFTVSSLILISTSYLGGYAFNLNIINIAILVTLLEQISMAGIDNITVPIFSSLAFHLVITRIIN